MNKEVIEEQLKHLKFSDLEIPAFLMAPPLGLNALSTNNQCMKDLKEEERIVNKDRALNQWLTLYNYVASEALVYLMPVPNENLQDLISAES